MNNPAYLYSYQRQYQYENVQHPRPLLPLPFPHSRHLTPQQWGASLRDRQSYHYHYQQQQTIARYSARCTDFWNLQWYQYYYRTAQAANLSRWQMQQWQTGMVYGNHALPTDNEVDQVDSNESQSEPQDQDVKMVDITELDVKDFPSDENETVGNGYTIEAPDSDEAENDSGVKSESDSKRHSSIAGSDKNGSEDLTSLWIQKFAIECEKNYDHMETISRDWDAIQKKCSILQTLSREIDRIQYNPNVVC